MEIKDSFGIGQLSAESTELIKMTYPDLAQPSFKKVGTALETVMDLSNTILLPLKLLNEKSALWYKKHMKKYEERLNEIPDQNIVQVIPDIGLPIIDRLTFLESEEIAELFIELLVSASISESCSKAHPTFIDFIKRMSVDEARIIKYLHTTDRTSIPFIQFIGNNEDYTLLATFSERLTLLDNELELLFPLNIDMYLSNLISMGLLYEEIDRCKTSDLGIIEEIKVKNKKREEDLSKAIKDSNNDKPPQEQIKHSISQNQLKITTLGKEFIKTCNK